MSQGKVARVAARNAVYGRRDANSRHATGSAPATFGELLQGRDAVSNEDFLVTLPITLSSVAKFYGFEISRNLYVFPRHKQKSLQAARLFQQRQAIATGGILQISSDVLEGKGLASSSADVVATLRALANYFGIELNCEEILSIMREIEPTDGVMFDDTVWFLHRKVELQQVIGRVPRLCILAVDEGGTIDTIEYNQQRFEFTEAEKQEYARLLDSIAKAILEQDVKLIGHSATASARLHQKRNPKRTLETLEQLVGELGAEGVINCHSGTLIGLCFDASAPESLERILVAESLLQARLRKPVIKFFSR